MARDNVTFIFRIDSAKAQQTLKALEAQVKKLGGEAVKTKQNVVSLGTGIDNSGQQAAASAVNFQTATQGMLNLSTAAVQTFTSISNLDRAHNRAKMSIIAVARAEDLLNNKQERLNSLRESGTASAEKLANMEREIATATADLTVKKEKQKIEQAAVNDIYMLFATNVANVTVSSMQTLAVLDKSDILLKKGRVLGQKLLNLTTWQSVAATRAEGAARRENMAGLMALPAVNNAAALSYKTMTFAQRASTMATRAGTMALNGLKIALGPIGLIFIGISAAMVAYESNLGGIKDTINDLLGITDDFEQNLINEREATEELTGATADFDNQLNKLPTTYSQALERMEEYRKKLLEVRDDQKLAAETADLLAGKQPLTLNQFAGNFNRVSQPQKGKNFVQKLADFLDPNTYLPSAAAQQTVSKTYNQFKIDVENLPEGFTKEEVEHYAVEYGIGLDFMSSAKRAEEYRAQQRDQMLAALHSGKSEVTGMLGSGPLSIQSVRDFEREFDPITSGNFLISNKPNKKYSDILGYEISDYEAGFLHSKAKRGGVELTKEEREVVKLIDKEKGVDDDLLRDYDKDLRKLSNREFVKQVYNTDIGAIANVIDRNEAKRLGQLEKDLIPFRNTIGGQTDNLLAELTKQGQSFRNMAQLNDVSAMTGGLIGGKTNFGKGFFKSTGATAAYQVKSVATPAHIRFAIARKDSFNNSLGGLIMNELNSLKGSGQMVYSSAHRSLYKSREFRGVPGRDVIREAVRLGIKGNVEFMDAIKAIPDVDREAEDNIQQAHAAIRQAEAIANDYISMVNSAKASIGFTDAILRRATAEGHSGPSMYANISLLSATKRTNFSNTEIIEESKAKLALTNSQIFAIRFNATRGDAELQDRLRYVDQLEAMSSGTSPL